MPIGPVQQFQRQVWWRWSVVYLNIITTSASQGPVIAWPGSVRGFGIAALQATLSATRHEVDAYICRTRDLVDFER